MFITTRTLTATREPAAIASPVSVLVTDITTTMTTTKTKNSYDTTTYATSKTAALTSAPTRTTITSDPGILCFHHCNVKVFCFSLPHICPNCKENLDTTEDEAHADGNGNANQSGDETKDVNEMGDSTSSCERQIDGNLVATTKVLLPFRLPYPFIRASQYPCAIVLRPTMGDFLNDYNNATDLHIAVTTSTGIVVEFDRHGLRQHRTENMPDWWQCLLVGDVPEPWYDYWDDVLLQICKQTSCWSIEAYQEDTHNCYTFVLTFLKALAYDKLSEAAHSKTTFCEKYIVPRTTTAGKYISLYRKLRDTSESIYVHPHTTKQQQQRQKIHHRGTAHGGYTKPSLLTVAATTTKTSNAMNSTMSSITTHSPALCTIEE